MSRFTDYPPVSEDDLVTPEDQQWLDEHVLEDRRAFPEFVHDQHVTSRFARYS